MHIENRTLGKKTKHYLAHSYREGAKVHKFRKYLGQDLPPGLLEERRTIAEKLILDEIHRYRIIKDPLKADLSKDVIDEVRRLQCDIPLKISRLSEKDWKAFSEIFTYNTNAIEGSTLGLKEVKKIIEEDAWPEKSKEDIAEAYGVDEAIAFIRETKDHISTGLIKKIHKIVFRNSKSFAGRLRKTGEEVAVVDSRGNILHEGAPPERIHPLLNQLVKWYTKNKDRYPSLILGAVVHNQFENIHPFRDGNGRVGRILLNNILIKHGLPPININFANRMEYYRSLRSYEHGQDLRPMIKLFIKEYAELKRTIRRRKH
ncbi:MAG: Fic family protein [Nanoarchaeota archaeon]